MTKSLKIGIWSLFGICFLLFGIFLFKHPKRPTKIITIQSRGLTFHVMTRAGTVGEVLKEQGFNNAPQFEGELSQNGMTIEIPRPVSILINDGGTEKLYNSSAVTVNDLLLEQKIPLARTDQVNPALGSFLGDNLKITIDRIVTLPVTEQKEIPFAVEKQNDAFAYYGQEQTVVVGHRGKKEQDFLITYKNGIEIKRKLVSERVLAKPVNELRTFGVKIEVIEESVGRASWYAYKGCECAAHPFYDKGRFVRVTSQGTGKSIIVKINDRGPEQDKFPDRIIDLDSTVFKQFAPLGAGTIGVKVELLKN